MENKDSIIQKIKKLLAMANTKDYNEHEAAVAAKQAQMLLDKHNLNSTDIHLEEIIEKPLKTTQRAPYDWMKTLALNVGINFNCQVFLRTGRKSDNSKRGYHKYTDTIFVGTEVDIEVAQYVFDYLYTTIVGMHRKFGKQIPIEKRKRSVKSYILGVSSTLNDKLREFGKAARDEVSDEVSPVTKMTGRELMRVKQDKIQNFLSRYNLKSSHSRGSSVADAMAYGAGQQDGNKINIRRGVASSNSRGNQLT